jgi:Flp pilus assembly protein protease CpaA
MVFVLAAVHPALIVVLLLSCAVVASVLVVAALALSSRKSREENVEERPLPPDLDPQRFPPSRYPS